MSGVEQIRLSLDYMEFYVIGKWNRERSILRILFVLCYWELFVMNFIFNSILLLNVDVKPFIIFIKGLSIVFPTAGNNQSGSLDE